jgi:hypothetical protein
MAGTSERTVRVETLERLLIDPVSCQAFIGLKTGKTIALKYAEATFADGEFDRLCAIHCCDQCSEVFETAQGLAGHKRIHEPRRETKEFISEMQASTPQKGKSR